jgi:large subunit ribosomal protein L18
MAGKNSERRERIKMGVRKKISGTSERPRLSVFRSNKGLFVQVIDDLKGATLASASTAELGEKAKLNIENSIRRSQRKHWHPVSIPLSSIATDTSTMEISRRWQKVPEKVV